MEQDTIVGIASGMGGGIGIIRISGDDALCIAGEVFATKKFVEDNSLWKNSWDKEFFVKKKSHTIHYGFVLDDDGSILDEVMVLLMKSPKSYTCEDVVEIDCHGGPFLIEKILKLLIHHGARLAEPGEFTKRAFLNGRIDLAQAEAVMKLISSKNEFALDSALKQLEGRVSKYIEKIRQDILHNMGYIEAALDDPEHYDLSGFSDELYEMLVEETKSLQELLDNFENGRMKSEGINTVIVGKPNAGKSSLMNLLLDEERAIVTNIAGTTRDILEEKVQIGNLVLNLVDTDASVPFDEADDKIISLLSGKSGVILLNKSDLDNAFELKELKKKIKWHCISFSSKTGNGLESLEKYIAESFLNGNISFNDQIYLTSVRHREAVEAALKSLYQVMETIEAGMPEDFYMIDMMDAYQKLGLIHGKTASEDLVNKIFKDFCMGK